MNTSAEDSGVDRIPSTAVGKDGITGTADDDVLEGDGSWTVECYTSQDNTHPNGAPSVDLAFVFDRLYLLYLSTRSTSRRCCLSWPRKASHTMRNSAAMDQSG